MRAMSRVSSEFHSGHVVDKDGGRRLSWHVESIEE
jgi:hypothetical protein